MWFQGTDGMRWIVSLVLTLVVSLQVGAQPKTTLKLAKPGRMDNLVPVPALEPGQPFALRTEALRTAPAPLGPPDRVGPRQLLTAVGAEDNRPRADAATTRGLPADLFQLIGQGSVHWAGNLNVFIGGKVVERHMAQALRVYPGKTNAAMFSVGDRNDGYKFELSGEVESWQAELVDMTHSRSMRPGKGPVIPTSEFREFTHGTFYLLMRPPKGAERGDVSIHVTRQSDEQAYQWATDVLFEVRKQRSEAKQPLKVPIKKVAVKAEQVALGLMPIVEADLRSALRVKEFETVIGEPREIVVQGYAI